jgi:hypothetical protein
VLLCETTNASFGVVPAPKSKKTRTGVTKFVPLIVTVSPPPGEPNAGVTAVTVGGGTVGQSGGHCGGAGLLNVTEIVFETLFTTACTVALPADELVSVIVATPFVVVRSADCAPVSLNVPMSVVNSTAVPFGTGCPFWVTVALMTDGVLTSGLAGEAVSVTTAPVTGVPPPLPDVEVGGAVGDSPLQAAKSATSVNANK